VDWYLPQYKEIYTMQSIQDYLAAIDPSTLMPRAEPFFLEAGHTGCLLLHGWGGTCDSMRYLGTKLHRAGISVFAPLLPGHGTSAVQLSKTRAIDWVHAAEDHLMALHKLYPAVFVAGLSLGAIMTLYLGEMFPDLLRGIIPINGGVYIQNPELAGQAFRRDIPDIVPGWNDSILLKDQAVAEVAYREIARSTIIDVLGLAKIVEEMLPKLNVPVLFLQSKEDKVIPPDNARYITERICTSNKKTVILNNSYHVATMDYDKDLVVEEIVNFISDYV
jgi:carboxylesterase